MESKDVQQLFKDVLGSAERGEQPLNCVEGSGAGQDPGRAQRPFLQGELQLSGQGGCTQGVGGGGRIPPPPPPPIRTQFADALSAEILGLARSFRNSIGKHLRRLRGGGFCCRRDFGGSWGGLWIAEHVVGVLCCVKVLGVDPA